MCLCYSSSALFWERAVRVVLARLEQILVGFHKVGTHPGIVLQANLNQVEYLEACSSIKIKIFIIIHVKQCYSDNCYFFVQLFSCNWVQCWIESTRRMTTTLSLKMKHNLSRSSCSKNKNYPGKTFTFPEVIIDQFSTFTSLTTFDE